MEGNYRWGIAVYEDEKALCKGGSGKGPAWFLSDSIIYPFRRSATL